MIITLFIRKDLIYLSFIQSEEAEGKWKQTRIGKGENMADDKAPGAADSRIDYAILQINLK